MRMNKANPNIKTHAMLSEGSSSERSIPSHFLVSYLLQNPVVRYFIRSKCIDLGQAKSVAPGPGCSEPD